MLSFSFVNNLKDVIAFVLLLCEIHGFDMLYNFNYISVMKYKFEFDAMYINILSDYMYLFKTY